MKTGILFLFSFSVCIHVLQAQSAKRSHQLEEWEKVRIGVPTDSTEQLIDEVSVKGTSFSINEDSNQYRALQKAIVKIKKAAVSMGGDFAEISQQEVLPIDEGVNNGISVHPFVSQKTLFRPGSFSSTEFQLLLSGQYPARGVPLYGDIRRKLLKSDADEIWAYYIQPYYRPYSYYGKRPMYSQRVDANNVLNSGLDYKCIIKAKIYKSNSNSNNSRIQDLIARVDKANDVFAVASKWKVTRSGNIQLLPFDAQTFSIDDYEMENGDLYVYMDLRRDPVHKFKVDTYDKQKMLCSYRQGHAIYYLLALKH